MVFTKHLREGVRRGRIRCSVRIWKNLHVKVGGRYPMDEGHIVVDSADTIERADITDDRQALLRRIRRSTAPAVRPRRKAGARKTPDV